MKIFWWIGLFYFSRSGDYRAAIAKREQNKTGRAPKAIDQLYLVAGAGFEPTTFGL